MKLTPYNLGAPIPEMPKEEYYLSDIITWSDNNPDFLSDLLEWQQKYRPLDNLNWKRFEDEKPKEGSKYYVNDPDYPAPYANFAFTAGKVIQYSKEESWCYVSDYETAKAQQQQYTKIDELGGWNFKIDDDGYSRFTREDKRVTFRPNESVLIYKANDFCASFEKGLSINLLLSLINEKK